MKDHGVFTLVLHSHIPMTIGYGIWPHGVDWLYEAVAESYIPILNTCFRLLEEGIPFGVTVGLTPILIEQLRSEEFKQGFRDYLEMKIDSAKRDEIYFTQKGDEGMRKVAAMWIAFYESTMEDWISRFDRDIVGAFKSLMDRGAIEILAGALTHCYSPLIGNDSSLSAQIKGGTIIYRKIFDRDPKGIWLPECGYRPAGAWKNPVTGEVIPGRMGVEEILHQAGLEYFFIDTHLLKGGKPINHYAERFSIPRRLKERSPSIEFVEKRDRVPWEPYYVASYERGERVVAFTRDPHTSLQVWSGEHGYPGEANYLDFHKKHHTTGLRYWRVTDPRVDLAQKTLYNPEWVGECVKRHADHFTGIIHSTLENYHKASGRCGIVVSPFDTELFGHWWFEGPSFIYEVMKNLAKSPHIRAMRSSDYLAENPPTGTVTLPEGSWGDGGFHRMWWNPETEWTWEILYEVDEIFHRLLERYKEVSEPEKELKRLFEVTAQELLLMQSSDWQFLITTGTAKDYAIKRFNTHYERFERFSSIFERALEMNRFEKDEFEDLIRGRFTPFDGIIEPNLWI